MTKKNRKKSRQGKPGRPADVVVSEVPPNPTAARKRYVGRPSLYDDAYPDALIAHMAEGYSFESFGGVIDRPCSTDTLYEWCKVHPEFSEAKKIGSAMSRHWWEQQGRFGMNAKGFNAAVWVFNMKNRFKWADRSEISGPDGGPISIKKDDPLTEEELARLAELQAKAAELEATEK